MLSLFCLEVILSVSLLQLRTAVAETTTTTITTGNHNDKHNIPSSFVNQKWILTQRPGDDPFVAVDHAELVHDEILFGDDDDDDDDTDVLVQVECLSIDAFLRVLLNDSKNAVHGGSLPIGSTLPAIGYGTVLRSRSRSRFRPGDSVMGMLGGQTICQTHSNRLEKLRYNRSLSHKRARLSWLGITGQAAYHGIFHVVPPPQKGQTMVISAAAGATGSVACQLAKTTGARVIGIAGGPHKQQWLVETLKMDGAVDYKQNLEQQLDECCPNGIDFYFDNVGGPMLDLILERINPYAKIVICGAISQYNNGDNGDTNHNSSQVNIRLAEKSATMAGLNLFHHRRRRCDWMFRFWMLYYYWRNQLVPYEQIETGIESFGPALEMLFQGGNTGKLLVDIRSAKL